MNTRFNARILATGLILACCAATFGRQTAPIIIADFEKDFAGWTVEGDAFGAAPATATLPNQMQVSGWNGSGYVNSYHNGDGSRGKMTSTPFVVEQGFISFLVGGGAHAQQTCINLLHDGKVVRTATGTADERLTWFTWDVKPFAGERVTLQIVDEATGSWGHINIDQIMQTDTPPVPPIEDAPIYAEAYRPQFHFTSQTGWLNDPNGLVYYKGEYHLFFQHNPKGTEWGNMTWGHAVSPDLLRWTQRQNAIEPDKLGTIFSGSAVVDWDNTSGFQKGNEKPLVAFYTAAGGTSPESKGVKFTQCLAYSTDAGKTWTKYDGNPIIPHLDHENRDPKVAWYEPAKLWILALYLNDDRFALFTSPDLKTWTKTQEFAVPGTSECPDFFEMKVKETGQSKWVFTVADTRYLVGSFDGKTFTPETPLLQVEYGQNNYAVQSYSDAPDGRRIQIGWMRNGKYPRMPFNQQMTIPVELTLRDTGNGPRLYSNPIREIESLHAGEQEWKDVALAPGQNPLADLKGDLFRIRLEIEPGDATKIGLAVRGRKLEYSVAEKRMDAIGSATVALKDGRLALEVLVDRTTIETFVNDGEAAISGCYLPVDEGSPLSIFAEGGTAKVVRLIVNPLQSVWTPEAK